jgi:endonuclease/exonuclease/phosphatase family metal-dependent hydrolase
MPFYKNINVKTQAGKQTVEGLLRLRPALDAAIPPKSVDTQLLLATWNIREFGGTKYGGREDEALYYIAEILSRFDLIAVQEVRDNLDALDRLMGILGSWWKYLVSDVTLGTPGNDERLAYVYDTRKLSFGGLAGELIPPAEKKDGKLLQPFAFARTPFLAGFRAGWFKFTICTHHLYYGQDKADDPQRVAEAQQVVGLLKSRMKSHDRWANNAVYVADMNVFTMEDETAKALGKGDFHIPKSLYGQYTNAKHDKPFDQMAFLAPDIERQMEVCKTGVFPFFDFVYREQDLAQYPAAKDKQTYLQWRTFKMSDHLPVWVQLGIDFAMDYLDRKITPVAAPTG